MSECISRYGEYSAHYYAPAEPYYCTLCGSYDEEAAMEAALAAERDALLAKFEALAEAWCRPGHESYLRINCADCMGNDFAAHLTAVIKEARA